MIRYPRNTLKYLLLVTATMAPLACVSTRPQPSPKEAAKPRTKAPVKADKPIAKPGQKIDDKQVGSAQQQNPEQSFIQALNTSYEILGSDLEQVKKRQPLVSRSLDEAYAVVVLLRFAASQSSSNDFVTKDLNAATDNANQSVSAQNPQSFRDLLHPYGVDLDLMRALRTNPFVQSTRIYQLAAEIAKRLPTNSPDRVSFVRLLQGKQQRFQSLMTEQALPQSLPSREDLPSNNEAGQDKQTKRQSVSNVSVADLRQGDSMLRQANQLAARGEYEGAIDLAARINTNDPYFAIAQEKIKEFSNMAVQTLRQKAAQAFQSSLPVSDRETKAAYLLEAQGYLKEAIDKYPKADQLNTVRENLEVISQDLEGLTEDTPKERG